MTWAYTLDIQATLRDTDALGHVNNAVYVNWFEEVRTAYICARRNFSKMEQVDFVLGTINVQYRSPVYMFEVVTMRCTPTRIGRSSWDLAYEGRVKSDGRLVVEGTSSQVHYDYAAHKSAPIPDDWRAMLEADRAKS